MTQDPLILFGYTLYVLVEFLMFFMLGRIVLALLTGGRKTFFSDLMAKATFPAYWVVRRITPRSVGDGHIPFLSLPLLLALRILLQPLTRGA
jgi:hypothetical protein